MKVIQESDIQERDVDFLALRVFLKVIEILGGPAKIIEYRNLTWLPSLMVSSYAVVLHEEMGYGYEEIAKFLGTTKNTIKAMLSASIELVKEKLKEALEEGEGDKVEENKLKTHVAGALAKLAYKEIKEGREELGLLSHFVSHLSDVYQIYWPPIVLKKIKGLDFPVTKEKIYEKLKELTIEGFKFDEIYRDFPDTIHSPSSLLKLIAEKIKQKK